MRPLPRFCVAVAALIILVVPTAHAQRLPDSVRAAGVTVAQWSVVQEEVRRAASARGASERALAAVAERVGANLVVNGRVDLDRLLASIDERAQQIAELQRQIEGLQQADDPTIADLLARASDAIEAGDLTHGDELLAQAVQSDLAGIARDRTRLAARQARAAETTAQRAELAFASADYLRAAELMAQAAETLPEDDNSGRWNYRAHQAAALRVRGELMGDPAALRESIAVFENLALPLAHELSERSASASTQNDLGLTYWVLAQWGDDKALGEAEHAFRAALEASTREATPLQWAMTQSNLGLVLLERARRGDAGTLSAAITSFRLASDTLSQQQNPREWSAALSNLAMAQHLLGERGDLSALRDAVSAYRTALQVMSNTRDRFWANTQNNLGNALALMGERGDDTALSQAVAAYRAALEVRTRANNPIDWAVTQGNLGNALRILGVRGDARALDEAVTVFRSALQVLDRATVPVLWAQTQHNLGNALADLGNRGDPHAREEAIVAYRQALEVRTRALAPADWAYTTYNLAHVYADAGRVSEARNAAEAALVVFEQVNNVFWAAEARAFISQLPRR